MAAADGLDVCDHCGGPLDDDARTDDALQTLCGACIDAGREEAFAARQGTISAEHAHAAADRAALAA